jgi:DNA-binding NarL/FixJ family response regulator
VRALEEALVGKCSLPIATVQSMAGAYRSAPAPDWVTPQEVEWLKFLAEGGTVAQLSNKAAYSERVMYRLLHALYGRLGVSSRTEALLELHRWGLLE